MPAGTSVVNPSMTEQSDIVSAASDIDNVVGDYRYFCAAHVHIYLCLVPEGLESHGVLHL